MDVRRNFHRGGQVKKRPPPPPWNKKAPHSEKKTSKKRKTWQKALYKAENAAKKLSHGEKIAKSPP